MSPHEQALSRAIRRGWSQKCGTVANKSQASRQRSKVQRGAGRGHAAYSDRSPSKSIVKLIIELKGVNKSYIIHNKRGRQASTGETGLEDDLGNELFS